MSRINYQVVTGGEISAPPPPKLATGGQIWVAIVVNVQAQHVSNFTGSPLTVVNHRVMRMPPIRPVVTITHGAIHIAPGPKPVTTFDYRALNGAQPLWPVGVINHHTLHGAQSLNLVAAINHHGTPTVRPVAINQHNHIQSPVTLQGAANMDQAVLPYQPDNQADVVNRQAADGPHSNQVESREMVVYEGGRNVVDLTENETGHQVAGCSTLNPTGDGAAVKDAANQQLAMPTPTIPVHVNRATLLNRSLRRSNISSCLLAPVTKTARLNRIGGPYGPHGRITKVPTHTSGSGHVRQATKQHRLLQPQLRTYVLPIRRN